MIDTVILICLDFVYVKNRYTTMFLNVSEENNGKWNEMNDSPKGETKQYLLRFYILLSEQNVIEYVIIWCTKQW